MTFNLIYPMLGCRAKFVWSSRKEVVVKVQRYVSNAEKLIADVETSNSETLDRLGICVPAHIGSHVANDQHYLITQ